MSISTKWENRTTNEAHLERQRGNEIMKRADLRQQMRFSLSGYFLLGSLFIVPAISFPALQLLATPQAKDGVKRDSKAIFEKRILPIFRSPNPSTCAECHLSGVDLKDYIRPTEAETFASLRDQGYIDMKAPERSNILRLIRMSTPKTALLTQKARDVEYNAFRDWVVLAARNTKLVALPLLNTAKRARPKAPDVVIRHTRKDTLLASFERNIWSQEGRCMGCHRAGTPANDANVKKFGIRVAWFVQDSPEETMRRVIAQGLVNVNAPEKSLLLLKPLNKAPHGGGAKFVYGDGGYKLFRAWIQDYAKSVKGAYQSVKDLPSPPKEVLYFTESILHVREAPAPWAKRLLRVDAYAWNEALQAWNRKPIATGDRQVAENRETNVLMFLSVNVGSEAERNARRGARLLPGRYLLKYYVDTEGKLESNPALPTDSTVLYRGEQEITAKWGQGWGEITHVVLNPKMP